MAACGVCNKGWKPSQVKLKCSDCEMEFHAQCFKMSKADVDCITMDGLPWRCKSCAESRRQSLRFDVSVQEGKLTLEDIMKRIEEIAETHKKQETNFNKLYELLSEKIDESTKSVNESNKAVEKYLKIIDDLVTKNKALEKKLLEAEHKIEDMEQYSRLNAVEILGVPEEKSKDVIDIVRNVGKALDMNIDESMIDACHRLGRQRGPDNRPPGIIVKIVRRLDKDELLRKRCVKSTLSTRHMNLAMDQPVYINESLSLVRRRLFAEVRQFKRQNNFKFLWVRGWEIFLRRDETAHVKQITCQADLHNI